MTGTYLSLIMILLSSRIPFFERGIGHDKMILWHRRLAPYAVLLIFLHVNMNTLYYAKGVRKTFMDQIQMFWNDYPWMPQAIIAEIIIVTLAIISYKRIRNKMRYEVWWSLHLLFYVSVILAFGHQLETGSIFVNHPLIKAGWIALYVGTFLIVVLTRFLMPALFSYKHKLKIDRVVQETKDVYSIYINGNDLDKVYAHGGQFFQWRFLTSKWWWQAHPYSLSRSPKNGQLRITVKILGDHSYDVARRLRPGTRIFAEGPYGIFTAKRRESNLIAAFAAGIGITPILAMLEELPRRADVVLIYRVSSVDDIILYEDLESLFLTNHWKLYYLIGDRTQHPMTANNIRQYIPDLSFREVYVCGTESFMDDVITLALNAGVDHNKIYHESFSF
jgi:predicted ferric reductase